ncbi:hypothetical protein SteCoe_37270 [Stentor coeruleus]|uniref:GRAM domain-containing protein n=1 Tax=Stentor coeruleus TaxID=5963 RepID=A0A1R2ANE5_9CILI|nr:hypothetical protein SteCoe_37270 [Stentor coeruleus]
MALNPPVLANNMPAPVGGEFMVLVRKDIEAEIALENGTKYKGKGKLYLTTIRLVFVNDKSTNMSSFDIPIDLMTHEKFNQPIFGANYISGLVKPLYNLIPCNAKFKFWFMSGGTGTFLPLFYGITDQIRKRRINGNQGPDPRFVESVASGNIQNVAYVDPNDPSVIFIQQPQNPNPPQNNVNYYFPVPGATAPPLPMQSPYPDVREPAPHNVSQPAPRAYQPQPAAYAPPPPSGYSMPNQGINSQYPPQMANNYPPPSNYSPPGNYPPPSNYLPPGNYPPHSNYSPPGSHPPPGYPPPVVNPGSYQHANYPPRNEGYIPPPSNNYEYSQPTSYSNAPPNYGPNDPNRQVYPSMK